MKHHLSITPRTAFFFVALSLLVLLTSADCSAQVQTERDSISRPNAEETLSHDVSVPQLSEDTEISQAGNRMDWDEFIETYAELSTDIDGEAMDQEMLEDLYEIHLNRLNLNDLDSARFESCHSLT